MKTIILMFVACMIAGCGASSVSTDKPIAKPVQAERGRVIGLSHN